MIKPKVALAMIVKAGDDSEAINLVNCLGSINGYIDAIYIQLNAPKGKAINPRMRQIAEQFTDKVSTYEWNNNFVDARNAIFAKVPKSYDWIVWLDADDKVENPENIVPSLAIVPDNANCMYIYYEYKKDSFGNIIDSLWANRAVRNNGSYRWKSSIDDEEESVHETLNPIRRDTGIANDEWKVVHIADEEHHRQSLVRNLEILNRMFRRQSQKPEGVDPRILYYLGTHCYAAYRFKEARDLFYQYLNVSGWPKERSEAHVYMGKLLKMEGKEAGARTAFLMALGEDQDNRNAYLELMRIESKNERWEQAASWGEKAEAIRDGVTAMTLYNPRFDILTEYSQALANLGGKNLTKALKMAQEALKLRPYDEDAKENRNNIQKLVGYRNNLRAVNTLINELNSEKKQITPLLDALPESIQDSVVVVNARQSELKPTTWPKRSIAIYVGQGPLGNWGPAKLNNGGLGGSEEAVIRLSRELAKLGWRVTVFGTPGKEAGKDHLPDEEWRVGMFPVEWKHYWEINGQDTFDVLVSWRQPGFFDHKWKARKTYLWLHDVVDQEELTPERIKNVTKVIYVSQYHADRPENSQIKTAKKFASGNGISPGDFSQYDNKFNRDPYRCIYMSANERGLRILLDIWPAVKEEVPDAKLDAYYGWNSFDAVNRDNPERMAWKATMVARMKELDGVTEMGRIGQDDLNKEIFKSGVFAYPSFFPEVNCITAQKAQAGGAWPVVSTYAALNDVVLTGDKIDMGKFEVEDIEKYKQALIYRLKNPPTDKERQDMMERARQTFDWSKTAEQWNEEMR